MIDARQIALTVLSRVARDEAFANLALDAELKTAGKIDPRDAALATELAYGVLRRRARLDAVLTPLVKGPLDALEPAVLELLRLGVYQLLFTRIPDHAAVSATIETAKAMGLGRASGLVNAVLRRLVREGARKAPDPVASPLAYLEEMVSLPTWLAQAVLDRFGPEEAIAFAHAIDRPAPASLRPNRTRTSRDALLERLTREAPGARLSAGPYVSEAIRMEGGGALAKLPSYREGLFSQQDEAAQAVGLLCAPAAGATVLDVCAAPGGKSCHLAELGAQVIALDVHERKARRILDEAKRLGLSLRAFAADATRELPPEARGPFELVLIDAPCSALGTLRRHPELRFRRDSASIARACETQARILDNVQAYVAPGGVLVYSVCSFLPEEGAQQIERFRARHPSFELAPLGASIESAICETLPHRDDVDGFFAVRLRRRGKAS